MPLMRAIFLNNIKNSNIKIKDTVELRLLVLLFSNEPFFFRAFDTNKKENFYATNPSVDHKFY